MSRIGRWLGLGVVLAGGLAELAAETPQFTPRVTDVTIFKDGHALVLAKAKVRLSDGWCETTFSPVPILGTFWSFVDGPGAKVDLVRAGIAPTPTTRPCLDLDEMIQANVGRLVTLRDGEGVTHDGVLLGILQQEAQAEAAPGPGLGPEAGVSSISVGPPRPGEPAPARRQASFLMLRKEAGVQIIRRENIRAFLVAGQEVATTITRAEDTRKIALHITGPSAGEEVEVGFVYVQKGLRWIPDYRIELLKDGRAKLRLQGTIINELADLAAADVRLVVGVPNFLMADQLSPLALREAGLRLSSFFQPPGGRPGSDRREYPYLSNAIMSQRAYSRHEAPEMPSTPGPAIPSEGGLEDLFLYHRPQLTLAKGERAVVALLETAADYEDIYTWRIDAAPPREFWGFTDQEELRTRLRTMGGSKMMHEVRLKNAGPEPWTTGPAAVMKDGLVLGQHLLAYTSPGNTVDVPITIATDLNTARQEIEIGREHNVSINDDKYTKVSCHGTLRVTNFKDRPVHVLVTRRVLGHATAAASEGKIRQIGLLDDSDSEGTWPTWYRGWPWWSFAVNALAEITWDARIEKGETAVFEYDWHYFFRR